MKRNTAMTIFRVSTILMALPFIDLLIHQDYGKCLMSLSLFSFSKSTLQTAIH